jgi:hypothetical protein
MEDQTSCTADASSNVVSRLSEALDRAQKGLERVASSQIEEVQAKIDELKEQGLLKRQQYAAATDADFQRILLKNV